MANYWCMVPEDKYAENAIDKGKTPDFYVQTTSHNPDLNDENQKLNLGSMAVVRDRQGYPEPSGDISTSADVKVFHQYMYYLLGNYTYIEGGHKAKDGSTRNVHEFFGGERKSMPSATCAFTYDEFMEKVTTGTILSSMKLTIGKELTTLEPSVVYSKEKVKKINIDEYEHNMLDAIPLIGYDYTVEIGTSFGQVISDLEIEIDNNVNTDKCTVLGSRWYARKPRFEKRDITITATTLFDEDNYEYIIEAMHGKYAPNERGYNSPHDCVSFHAPVKIKARTCENTDEFIWMIFPWCIIELDPIEANEGVLEASLTITPEKVKSVTTHDGNTKITDIFVQVVNDQPQLQVAEN